jgi:hypothetical protein
MLPSDLRDVVFDRIRRLSSGQQLPREQRPRGWPRRRDGFPPPLFVSPRRRLVAAAAVMAIVVVGGGIGAAITTGPGDDRRVVVSDERRGPTTSTSRDPALAVSPTAAPTAAPPTAPASGSPGSSPSDTTGPAITGVGASPASIVAGSGSGCENNQSVVTVGASDPSGISSVTISWVVGTQSGAAPAQGGGYLIGPLAYQAGLIDAPVVLTVTARDGRGNATTITNSSALRASTCFF